MSVEERRRSSPFVTLVDTLFVLTEFVLPEADRFAAPARQPSRATP